MIVCLRTVVVPADVRDRYLAWIQEGGEVRRAHGILAELVCEPSSGEGETVVVTVWPDDSTFDAWIATPERDALTASEVHQAVEYRPITRYGVAGGYLNLPSLPGPADSRGGDMKWVTRARPKTDRIACPWLIRRFIDPDAEILYVPKDDVLAVAHEQDARSFDAPGAEFDHRDGRCTFEVMIDHFNLGADAALVRLAAVVHAADIDHDLDTDPLGPGLLAIGVGGLEVEADDHRLLERASFVYDALYAWSAGWVATT